MVYSYFDSPDGYDCYKKLGYMLKRACLFGVTISSVYVLAIEKPSTYLQAVASYTRITSPLLTAAAAGTVSVCLLTLYRDVDDKRNHLYGGFIGGLAGGLAKGHPGHGIFAGIFLGLIAMVVKDAKLHNYDLFENEKPKLCTEDHWTKDYDWTMSRKIPPDWTAK